MNQEFTQARIEWLEEQIKQEQRQVDGLQARIVTLALKQGKRIDYLDGLKSEYEEVAATRYELV